MQKFWHKGWGEFGPWPTHAVLKSLEISPNELGIVGRLKSKLSGSGEITPIIMYYSNQPNVSNRYRFYFKSMRNLSYAEYELFKVGSKVPIKKNRLLDIYGDVPFPIVLNFSNQPAGYYELIINCQYVVASNLKYF